MPTNSTSTANNLPIKLEGPSFITLEGPDACENVVVNIPKNCILGMNFLDKFKTNLINTEESYVI